MITTLKKVRNRMRKHRLLMSIFLFIAGFLLIGMIDTGDIAYAQDPDTPQTPESQAASPDDTFFRAVNMLDGILKCCTVSKL